MKMQRLSALSIMSTLKNSYFEMECFHPLSVRNPKWLDGDTAAPRWIVVPCGKCAACLTNRRTELANRVKWEADSHLLNIFFTLTYDELELPIQSTTQGEVPYVSKEHIQLFLKRLRSNIERSPTPFKIRYIVVSEYGPTTLRPHYHGIIFGWQSTPDLAGYFIQRSWPHGFADVGPLRDGGHNYVAKYILRPSTVPSGWEKNFALWSRRPALGSCVLSPRRVADLQARNEKLLILPSGRAKLPRVLAQKVFDESQLRVLGSLGADYRDARLRRFMDSYGFSHRFQAIEYLRDHKTGEENRLINKLNSISKKSKL